MIFTGNSCRQSGLANWVFKCPQPYTQHSRPHRLFPSTRVRNLLASGMSGAFTYRYIFNQRFFSSFFVSRTQLGGVRVPELTTRMASLLKAEILLLRRPRLIMSTHSVPTTSVAEWWIERPPTICEALDYPIWRFAFFLEYFRGLKCRHHHGVYPANSEITNSSIYCQNNLYIIHGRYPFHISNLTTDWSGQKNNPVNATAITSAKYCKHKRLAGFAGLIPDGLETLRCRNPTSFARYTERLPAGVNKVYASQYNYNCDNSG